MRGNGKTDTRRAQFEFEREWRNRILQAPREQRPNVMAAAYGELFDRFSEHDVYRADAREREWTGKRSAALFGPLTRAGDRVLEIGCGRGDMLYELARAGRVCVGIDPSSRMIAMCRSHPNASYQVGTAEHLDFPDEFFNAVVSQQVLEHLHPDDVPVHLAEAFRVLRPGGIIAIETPNRRTGPQDVSRGFTTVAEGLHLKEWSYRDLPETLRAAGFTRPRGLLVPPYLVRKASFLHGIARVPIGLRFCEDWLLGAFAPPALRRFVAKAFGLDDVFVFAYKPESALARSRVGVSCS